MLLNRTDILTKGEEYTFTHNSGELVEDSESWVMDQLSTLLSEFGTVQNVDRGIFSGRYAVTVVPTNYFTLADWLAGFEFSYQQMGWEDNKFVQAEGGSVSSQPGGTRQVMVETVQGVAGTIGDIGSAGIGALLRPLAPYIIMIAGTWLAYEYVVKRKPQQA